MYGPKYNSSESGQSLRSQVLPQLNAETGNTSSQENESGIEMLLSLRNPEDGSGLEVFLEQTSESSKSQGTHVVRDIVIRTYSSGAAPVSERVRGVQLQNSNVSENGGWYWLGVSVTPPSYIWKASVAVYVDGYLLHQGYISYPSSPLFATNKTTTSSNVTCCVGASTAVDEFGCRQEFLGQISRVSLFAQALTAGNMFRLFDLQTRRDGSPFMRQPMMLPPGTSSMLEEDCTSDPSPPGPDAPEGSSVPPGMYKGSFGAIQRKWDHLRAKEKKRQEWRSQGPGWSFLPPTLSANAMFIWDAKHVVYDKNERPVCLGIGSSSIGACSILPSETKLVTSSCPSGSLYSLGGIRNFLPMLLDCIHTTEAECCAPNSECSTSASMLARVVSVVADIVSFEFCHGANLSSGGGFFWMANGREALDLVRSVITRCCPNSLTVELVMAFAGLADTLFSLSAPKGDAPSSSSMHMTESNEGSRTLKGTASHTDSPSGTESQPKRSHSGVHFDLAVECTKILFDLGIWSSASIQVQKSLFRVLHYHIDARHAFICEHVGGRNLLDALSLYYYREQPHSPLARRPCQPPLTPQDIDLCRSKIWGLVDALLCGGRCIGAASLAPYLVDKDAHDEAAKKPLGKSLESSPFSRRILEVILEFCQAHKSDPSQLKDTLQYLISLISRARKQLLPGLLLHIRAIGNLIPIWPLLRSRSSVIRTLTIRVIQCYVGGGENNSDRPKLPAKLKRLDTAFSFEIEHARHVADLLQSNGPVTADNVEALWSFALGEEVDASGHLSSVRKDGGEIRTPLALWILLTCVSIPAASSDVRTKVIQMIATLIALEDIKSSAKNLQAITKIPDWQVVLCNLAAAAYPSSARAEEIFCAAVFHQVIGFSEGPKDRTSMHRNKVLRKALAVIDMATPTSPDETNRVLKWDLMRRLVTRAVQLVRESKSDPQLASSLEHAQSQLDHLIINASSYLVADDTSLGEDPALDVKLKEDLRSVIIAFYEASIGTYQLSEATQFNETRRKRFEDADTEQKRLMQWKRLLTRCDPTFLGRQVATPDSPVVKQSREKLAQLRAETLSRSGSLVKLAPLSDMELNRVAESIPPTPGGSIWFTTEIVVGELGRLVATLHSNESDVEGRVTGLLSAVHTHLIHQGILAAEGSAGGSGKRRSFSGKRNHSSEFGQPIPILRSASELHPSLKESVSTDTHLGSPFMVPSRTNGEISSSFEEECSDFNLSRAAFPPRTRRNSSRLLRRSSSFDTDAFVLIDESDSPLAEVDIESLIVLYGKLVSWFQALVPFRRAYSTLMILVKRIRGELCMNEGLLPPGFQSLAEDRWANDPTECSASMLAATQDVLAQLTEARKIVQSCIMLYRESVIASFVARQKEFQIALGHLVSAIPVQSKVFELNQYEEEARKSAALCSMRDQDDEAFRKWKVVLRNAAISPFTALRSIDDATRALVQSNTVWKLDRRENGIRMRIRLKRAFGATINSAASAGLKQSRRKENEPTSNGESMLQGIRKTLSSLRLQSLAEDADTTAKDLHVEDEAPENVKEPESVEEGTEKDISRDLSHVTLLRENGTSSNSSSHDVVLSKTNGDTKAREVLASPPPAVAVSSADWDVVELTSVHYAARNERVVYSTECELVLPMYVVRGRLDLTARHIYFYGDFTASAGQGSADTIPSSPLQRRRSRQGSADSASFTRPSNWGKNEVLCASNSILSGRRWALDDVTNMHRRRYLLQRRAMELFFSNRKNYLFSFGTPADCTEVWNRIIEQQPRGIINLGKIASQGIGPRLNGAPGPLAAAGLGTGLSVNGNATARTVVQRPQSLFKQVDRPVDAQLDTWMQQWVNWEISTFEYLMLVNTAAGRTYNDLTQYPVFPWILNDYSSNELDLENPLVYRDLSKPIGALEPERLARIKNRKASLDACGEQGQPSFLYGSHYSSVGTVLYYLVRVEPFATYARELQGGHFDHADRLFHSVQETWRNCMTSDSDLKELVPEWFYLDDVFENSNKLNLGQRQDGTMLGDVKLPPWANSSPACFVRKHREALEGEYVSAHIHAWIDLVFGYKQRGPEAEKADNLFYYVTYEDAVDRDKISDPVLKRSIEAQIANFGQTPAQLFLKPHPQRKPRPTRLTSKPSILFTSETHLPLEEATDELPQVRFHFRTSEERKEAKASLDRMAGALLHEVNQGKGGSPSRDFRDAKDSTLFPFFVLRAGGVKKLVCKMNIARESPPVELHTMGPSAALFSHWALSLESKVLAAHLSEEIWRGCFMRPSSVCVLAAGTCLATVGHLDDTVKIHSLLDKRLLQNVFAHNGSGSATCLVADREASNLAIGYSDGSMAVWKLNETDRVVESVVDIAENRSPHTAAPDSTQSAMAGPGEVAALQRTESTGAGGEQFGKWMSKFMSAFSFKKRAPVPVVEDSYGPAHLYAGFHGQPVTAMCISSDLGLAGSCALFEHHIILQSLGGDGRFLRAIDLPPFTDGLRSVTNLSITALGHLIVAEARVPSSSRNVEWFVHTTHINDRLLATTKRQDSIIALLPFSSARYVLLATSHQVSILEIETLAVAFSLVDDDTSGSVEIAPICSVDLSSDEVAVSIARKDGTVKIVCFSNHF